MSRKERRVAPRKACTIPIRFRTFTSNELTPATVGVAASGGAARVSGEARERVSTQETIIGQTVDISERGIRFKSPLQFTVGESVEVFLTLPRELTGRRPEEVRCDARIVHVDMQPDAVGMTGVGATVERFEPLNNGHAWAN
jgi:PilZ domain